MSRSRRKTPMFGYTTATSEAEDKRIWHKRWRAQLRGQLSRDATTDDFLPILQCAVSSPWNMDKDGKSWFSPRQQRRQGGQRGEQAAAVGVGLEQRLDGELLTE